MKIIRTPLPLHSKNTKNPVIRVFRVGTYPLPFVFRVQPAPSPTFKRTPERTPSMTHSLDRLNRYTVEVMLSTKDIQVTAFWDDEAEVWVAQSEQVPGLSTEADTLEKLLEKLETLVPELLELNGRPLQGELVNLKAERVVPYVR